MTEIEKEIDKIFQEICFWDTVRDFHRDVADKKEIEKAFESVKKIILADSAKDKEIAELKEQNMKLKKHFGLPQDLRIISLGIIKKLPILKISGSGMFCPIEVKGIDKAGFFDTDCKGEWTEWNVDFLAVEYRHIHKLIDLFAKKGVDVKAKEGK